MYINLLGGPTHYLLREEEFLPWGKERVIYPKQGTHLLAFKFGYFNHNLPLFISVNFYSRLFPFYPLFSNFLDIPQFKKDGSFVDHLKNILFIIIAIMLAVVIEAITVNSAQEIRDLIDHLMS